MNKWIFNTEVVQAIKANVFGFFRVNTQWLFITEVIQAIKTPFYGAAYTAQLSIKFVNGECHVTSLLTKNNETLNRADFVEVENEILKHGYDQYTLIRFKNGKPLKRTYKIKR